VRGWLFIFLPFVAAPFFASRLLLRFSFFCSLCATHKRLARFAFFSSFPVRVMVLLTLKFSYLLPPRFFIFHFPPFQVAPLSLSAADWLRRFSFFSTLAGAFQLHGVSLIWRSWSDKLLCLHLMLECFKPYFYFTFHHEVDLPGFPLFCLSLGHSSFSLKSPTSRSLSCPPFSPTSRRVFFANSLPDAVWM